jgi:hypothetical protein
MLSPNRFCTSIADHKSRLLIAFQLSILMLFISIKLAVSHRGSARYFAIGMALLWLGSLTLENALYR